MAAHSRHAEWSTQEGSLQAPLQGELAVGNSMKQKPSPSLALNLSVPLWVVIPSSQTPYNLPLVNERTKNFTEVMESH